MLHNRPATAVGTQIVVNLMKFSQNRCGSDKQVLTCGLAKCYPVSEYHDGSIGRAMLNVTFTNVLALREQMVHTAVAFAMTSPASTSVDLRLMRP